MFIPLKDIAVINRQRRQMDPDKLQQLAKSIQELGRLIHPINVRATTPEDVYPDDYPTAELRGKPVTQPWILVTGGRRTAAHLMLGRETIEARDYGALDPLEREIVELEENISREDISWQDQVLAQERIYKLRASQGKTAMAVAEEIGVSRANLSKDLQLAKLIREDPELKKAPTKRAALRTAEHKQEISRRVAAIKAVDVSSLRSKLVTADARDFVRSLETNSIDLCFTDLPWGIDYKSANEIGTEKGTATLGKYDDSQDVVRDLVADLIPQIARVVKPSGWIVLMFATDGMEWLKGLLADSCSVHGEYRAGEGKTYCAAAARTADALDCEFLRPEPMPWIWYKPNARNISQWPDRHAKHVYETICVCNGGKAKFALLNQPDVLVHDNVYEGRLHEMQKPLPFCQDIIRRCTVPGERVLDLTFGSGSALAAAASLGRDFVGCDLNPDNLGAALSLVAQHYSPAAAAAVQAGMAGARRTAEELDELSAEELEAIQ